MGGATTSMQKKHIGTLKYHLPPHTPLPGTTPSHIMSHLVQYSLCYYTINTTLFSLKYTGT